MAVRNKISVAISIFGLILGAGGLSVSAASLASADSTTTVNGCTFETTATTWTLLSNCSSTHEIDLPAGVTLDGENFTISPTFTKVPYTTIDNTTVGVVNSNDVAIHDLTIDGMHGTNLHGINVYVSNGIKIDHVTVKNMSNTGIVVNSSAVSVSNVTTSNNRWNGIDVDQKTSAPATLNIVGPMTQTDVYHIFVDDVTKAVTVNDFLHQYSVKQIVYPTKSGPVTGALYTRIYATDKQTCKDGGWKLGLSATQSFENQGQCVAHFESDDKNSSGDKKD